MNRNRWIVAGIVVIALGILNVILGMNLVPTIAVATERGTAPGWWLIWSVIALTVVCALALGAFLLAAGLGKVPETADQ
jgi:threonine/homoserine/homoserine lactone efflux protein